MLISVMYTHLTSIRVNIIIKNTDYCVLNHAELHNFAYSENGLFYVHTYMMLMKYIYAMF